MRDLVLLGFVAAIAAMGLKRPFLWVLLYIYVDIVTPQKVGYGIITSISLSLLCFVAAFAGYVLLDSKKGSRFTLQQGLIVALLIWCGITTLGADFPEAASAKWDWVWKSLVCAAFLPLTLRTKLRLEAAALIMVLSAASIIISAGIKTVLSGGGYGTLVSLVQDNSGLYEGSTLSTVAIAMIPLTVWVARHGTIFTERKLAMAFAAALVFAALLVPVGTQTRTGLLCIAALGVLVLRSVRYRFVYAGLAGLGLLAAIPFLPAEYTERMATITEYRADESASTRVAVWRWTMDYVAENPMGGGFDAFLGNSFTYRTRQVVETGGTQSIEYAQVTDEGRAYHSAYFEVLGEQGVPGFLFWIALHASCLINMERIRRRLRKSEDEAGRRWHSLATALQNGHLVYLVGAVFVGVGYQPFMFMLLGLQIAFWSIMRREWTVEPVAPRPWQRETGREEHAA
ncbi:putative O-glycosylation ligase, exosortase A system-associated [Aurantiacibacter poecillastricola]|uniref:putative O-glycosylation ligase, exosortase A system-associated n=1 Tax=Aurantiacibacter poecillastricola TaxID=3064385 RepID=UPI00273E7CEB|nr:putative O-glycosylation ligase, exosortase A system-associated [Aurantiacibacter sp. 219JJ12-13]MDP5260740.1 putative O-glycosylation ligase, exosortase A system-associated [Aurantiacibacter sp. 219JJ12-13]